MTAKEKSGKGAPFVLAKDVLKRVDLGSSFAEYDLIRKDSDLFVETAAIRATLNLESNKSIFVGRRGTGKTAATFYLEQKEPKTTVLLLPQVFSIVGQLISPEKSGDVHQRPFKTLVNCFKRALLDEVVSSWLSRGIFQYRPSGSGEIHRNRGETEDFEFDNRIVELLREGVSYLDDGREKDWNRFDNRVKKLQDEVNEEARPEKRHLKILIDRIDEDWDGSDAAVTMLMALLHACVQLNAIIPGIKLMVFIRENMFDRVREADKEYSRIETSIVSLEWTREQLREVIERRLNRKLLTKPALGGPTWNAFFANDGPTSSEDAVFDYCQYRPREVLTYCSFALEIAQSKNHSQILYEDLAAARVRFSVSRLKELSDEYAENFPGLGTLLESFFGLGRRFTYKAIDDFVKKLLVNKSFKDQAAKWIYRYTSPESFMSLLYGIGFAGIKNGNADAQFRLHEGQPLTPSDIAGTSILVIHETYTDALQLQDKLVPSIDEGIDLRQEGMIADLPEAFSPEEYKREIDALREQLNTLPKGHSHSAEFEDLAGHLITLCFYRALSNVEAKSRPLNGVTVKDWIAGNHAASGFWRMVREHYRATQIVFECKNYDALSADDFQQVNYYMNDTTGRFVVIIARFSKDMKRSYYGHIRAIVQAQSGKAMVLVLGEWNLQVLLRQALNNKNNDPHLQEIFDRTVRMVAAS